MTDLRSDALMASLADAVYLVDAAGEVSFANPAALAMLGYDDELELIGATATRRSTRTAPTARRSPRTSARCCGRG